MDPLKTRNEDHFPIENGDIPASCVSLPEDRCKKGKTLIPWMRPWWFATPKCAIGSINSHYFQIIGDKLINPINSRGLWGPSIRIPYKRWDEFIPNIATFDHGTNNQPRWYWRSTSYLQLRPEARQVNGRGFPKKNGGAAIFFRPLVMLGGGFKYFLFSPIFREMIHFH